MGVAEQITQVLDEGAGDFDEIGIYRGRGESRVRPEVAADEGQGIGKGGKRFAVPGGLAARQRRPRAAQVMGEQRDEGEQAEQSRRGTGDRAGGPLALHLDAQMGADFTEGDCELPQRPVQDEPGDDLHRVGGEVGAQEGLRGERARGSPGAGTSTQRMGTGGRPVWYHTAVSESRWMGRSRSPYQRASVKVVQGVARVAGVERASA